MLSSKNTGEGNAIKRLKADLVKLRNSHVTDVYAEPSEKTMLIWNGYVIGPEGSYYEGGKFNITIQFTKDYPQKPPEVKFTSHIFHPNIFFNGDICLEELEDDWNPNYDVLSVLLLTQHLLREPNFCSPANPKASKLFRKNEDGYKQVVKASIEKNKDHFKDFQNKRSND